MRFVRLALLMLILIIIEALYSHLGGRWVRFFSPLLILQASSFVGVLAGPKTGLWWGLIAGFLEESYFASIGTPMGLTSLVYLWAGWISGRLLYGRVDLASSMLSFFVTFLGLVMASVLARLLEALYASALPTLSGGFTLGRFCSFIFQIIAAPLLFWMTSRFLGKSRDHEEFYEA
ncbi:MAG: hypothetical protein HY547_03695 [Elusimicrobia bacterium]|nr:hypothetical protein [Elusimicrobiota bacterium]